MTGDISLTILRGVFGLAAGAVVGSFGATAALRLADGRNPFVGRSQCDGCARSLGWAETVPFAGYMASRGHCKSCGGRIAGFHLAGEGLGAIAFALPLLWLPDWTGAVTGILCLLLLIAALIDLKTLRLPDPLTAGVAVCSLGLADLSGHLVSGLIASIVAGGMLFGVKVWLERRSGTPMLGLGDVKLVAALALWLNLRTPVMLALAAIAGLIIIQRHKGLMPFGPMIAASSFVIGVLLPHGWFA